MRSLTMERISSTLRGPDTEPNPVVHAPVAAQDAPAIQATVPLNFGKYEIITHLASGGMADIFLSRARGIEGFEKLAIIKRIRQDRAFDKKMIDLFLDE